MTIMVFRRNFNRLRPVDSIKKVIDVEAGLVAATTSTNVLLNTTSGTAWVDANDSSVPQGCHVYGLYLSIYATLDGSPDASVPVINWFIFKNPSGSLTPPVPGATGGNENRRFILHEQKGLLGFDTPGAPPRKLFEGVIKIPRHMQRMGRDDEITVLIRAENQAGFFCLKSIYKFFR